ncbi:hypothetical protein BJ741DRAFT_651039 [Chytriomyces cf. hyalinus JEL632]|nr:hypothetical protein BJ741DRAFT_651039 [Chytriomyces cf. hyalinus JEL632]
MSPIPANPNLVDYGKHCGGFILNPATCKPGLVCILGPLADRGGLCARKSVRRDCSIVQLSFPTIDFGKTCGRASQFMWNEKLELVSLTVTDAKLTGGLPSFLAGLKSLRVLNLSGNSFSGAIPNTYAQFRKLSKFDVTGSDVTGTTPSLITPTKQCLKHARKKQNGKVKTVCVKTAVI